MNPTDGAPRDHACDLARAVFGIGYRFDDKTEFNSEYEVEHAVVLGRRCRASSRSSSSMSTGG